MRIVEARLVERIKRTQSIESFRFIPAEQINFAPGQFLQVLFAQDDPNNKELNKYLSFSSSPTRDYIEITKRLSQSQFSHRLNSLNIGDSILLKAPLGNCVFDPIYRQIVFLIGGIGITPAISIIEYIFDKGLATDVILVYSNKIKEDIAFKQQLDYWRENNHKIKVIYTLTECDTKIEDCIIGRIDSELLKESIVDLDKRTIFVFGPPQMVGALRDLCIDMGCKKEDLKTESFVGY